MSPKWQDVPPSRIPKRLRGKVRGARGPNNTFCFKTGNGPFQQGTFAAGLVLEPDSPTHGCITPAQLVPLAQFENDLAATRPHWQVEES